MGWVAPVVGLLLAILTGFLLILASILQAVEGKSMERLSTYSRGGALLAFIVATLVTVLAALDSLTRESNILLVCGCWFFFGVLWLLDTRLSQSR